MIPSYIDPYYTDTFQISTVSFWAIVVLSVCLSCLSVTLSYCGQTVGLIKMPLGTEAGLSAGNIVLDGDPAPAYGKGHSSFMRFSSYFYFRFRRAELLFLFYISSQTITLYDVRKRFQHCCNTVIHLLISIVLFARQQRQQQITNKSSK